MKQLATISCRLGGSDCYCAFSFSRPLTDVGHDYFKEPRSLLATREGEVCMKYKDSPYASPSRSPWRSNQVPKGLVVAHGATINLDAGKNTLLGWSDPTLGHGSVPKVSRGSLQPNF